MTSRTRPIVVTVVLVAALVGCGDSTSSGDPGSTSESTVPTSSVPQPPSITFTERERAPQAFAAKDALECLRSEGLMVALPAGFPGADDVRPALQPFEPTISGPAWRQCRAEIVSYLEVAPQSPESAETLMTKYDCMADQGFIDLFRSTGKDSPEYGQALASCSGIATSGAGLLLCDAFRVGADETMETSPIRTDLEQLITVDATAPPTSSVGTPFVVTILPYKLTMPPTLYGFTVVDGSSFVRAFTADGGSIDPASVRSNPSESDVAVSAQSDGTTATFRYEGVVAATESIEFPEATFEVTPSAPGRAVITFSGYEQSITFDVDGERRVVRTICTSRFGTPLAWSDAT